MALGLYGPEYLQFDEGGPAAEILIFVFLPGTKTKAQLFADKTGQYTGSNPVWTDRRGELVFFAEEGTYDLWFQYPEPDGSTISVEIDNEDVIPSDVIVHNQTTPADIWEITHNFGVRPGITAEEFSALPSDMSYPAIRHLDANTVQLRWGYATSGRATLRR
jgi:hypothetical protein